METIERADESQNRRRNLEVRILHARRRDAGLQYLDPQRFVERMHLDAKAAREPGAHALLERFQLARRAIGGDDDLPARIDQRIEGMAKFSLDDLALKELRVIEYQEIDRPQRFFECDRGLRLQCRDEAIHEFFGGQINDRAPLRGRRMRDRLK